MSAQSSDETQAYGVAVLVSATVLIHDRGRYYKVRVNPLSKEDRELERYTRLADAYVRQSKRGRLASMIRLHREILKLENAVYKSIVRQEKSI
jgi:hypothetical protein